MATELARKYVEYARAVLREPEKWPYEVVRMAMEIRALAEMDKLEVALCDIARKYGGCVACRWSEPAFPASLSLLARTCRLGLSQGNCKKFLRLC